MIVVIKAKIDEKKLKKIIAEEKELRGDIAKIEIYEEEGNLYVKSYGKSPIKRIRRITGYMSSVDRFNAAKVDELKDRVVHC